MIKEKRLDDLKKYLLQNNLGPQIQVLKKGDGVISRTFIVMDATGSMGGSIEGTKKVANELYVLLYQTLTDNNITEKINIKFIAYRNYGSRPENLIQCSEWTQEPQKLQEFLKTVTSLDGEGNEAVEAGLYMVNKDVEQYFNDNKEDMTIEEI